jgi:hypothetical protein
VTSTTIEKRRRRVLGGLAGGALAAIAVLAAFTASGTAARAAVPQNTSKPTITGKEQDGQTLSGHHGEWSNSPSGYSYQWRRCGNQGGNCSNISKATDKIYTLSSDDVGHTIRLLVTASNNDGAGTATSDATGAIQPAAAQAPSTSSQPRITGTAKVGETLTAQPNSWNGTKPIQLSYRWRLCDEKGGDCVSTTLTSQSIKLTSAMAGKTVRVVVTATNSAGSASAVSDPSPVIQPASGSNPPPPPPPSGGCAAVSTVSLPNQLLIDRIQYTPSQIHSRDEPLVAKFHVTSTKGGCVSGALVYAVGVPFDRLSKAQEVPTGSDGWATVTFQIKPTFELRPGNLVVIFVRARKPGDSVLTGVSTRRLVSVRVGG